MEQEIQYGKYSVTKVGGNKTTEVSHSIVAGSFISPSKIHTEESIEIKDRSDQDEEYIRFADEEERLQKAGKLLEAEFQIKRTPASTKRGTRYAVKKFTFIDSSNDCELYFR